MITRFRIENFKGHRDTDLALQRFTLLVGDNGSGKTSVLEALRLPGQLDWNTDNLGLEDLLRRGTSAMTLSFDGLTRGQPWATAIALLAPGHSAWGDTWALRAKGTDESGPFDENLPVGPQTRNVASLHRATRLIGKTALYRFRSDQVAATAYSDRPEVSVAQDGAQTG